MSENIFGDRTDRVNGHFPVFRPGEVITYQDFRERMAANFGFADRTFARWKAAGFRVFYPGTAGGWVRTDDVIAMICRDEELPRLEPEPAQKVKAKRKPTKG